MINFEFASPTKVIFGKDTEMLVGSEIKALGGTKVLVHFGGTYLQETGLLDKIHKALSEAGLTYIDLDTVVPNPRLQTAKDGLKLCKDNGVDFLLAVGGGSAIDSCKAIAYGLANNIDLEDLYMGRVKVDKTAPVGVISTIPASGSETSNSSVITVEKGNLKRFYNHECSRPKFAIMNPETTYSLPVYQTASGGCDILFHTTERYFTTARNVDLTDRLCEALLTCVMKNLKICIAEPKNYDARAEMMWAASLSHNGLMGTGRIYDGASHRMEHELGGMFDVPHGAGITALWGSWARYCYKTDVNRFAQFATRVMKIEPNFYNLEETALAGIAAFEEYFRSVGMPTNMKELGISPTTEQIKVLAVNASAVGVNGLVGGFRKLSIDDMIKIYTMAI